MGLLAHWQPLGVTEAGGQFGDVLSPQLRRAALAYDARRMRQTPDDVDGRTMTVARRGTTGRRASPTIAAWLLCGGRRSRRVDGRSTNT